MAENAVDGVVVINKPAGMTSHDVIARLRRQYKQKKFGHTGTLDPNATGVLVVLAGKAVKLSQFLKDTDKSYRAEIALGRRYSTDDIWGEELESRPVNDDFDFDEVLKSFKGKLHQRVPDTSAKKVNGKKLMEYQREGLKVPIVYNDVEVYDIHASDPKKLQFDVDCSSGTYVRSICRDFGEKTGNLAAMSSLVRTRTGGFTLDMAQSLDEPLKVYPAWSVLDMERIHDAPMKDVYNGKPLILKTKSDQVLIMDGDEMAAVYERDHDDLFTCKRGLWG